MTVQTWPRKEGEGRILGIRLKYSLVSRPSLPLVHRELELAGEREPRNEAMGTKRLWE